MQSQLNFDCPAQRHSPTSVAAATAIAPRAGTLRAEVYAWLLANGPATDEEGIAGTELGASTYRPRRIELVRAGLVFDSGLVAKTASGHDAVRWAARKANT
jgi:hypothetical protein